MSTAAYQNTGKDDIKAQTHTIMKITMYLASPIGETEFMFLNALTRSTAIAEITFGAGIVVKTVKSCLEYGKTYL